MLLLQEGRLRSAVMHEGERKLHEWSEMPAPKFPEDGILWRGWTEETIGLIKDKDRPFLLFITDPRPEVSPALKKLLKALPENPSLRGQLKNHVAVLLAHYAVAEPFKSLGAGETFHVAVFSPTGTPLVTIKLAGETLALVDEIALVLKKLRETWISEPPPTPGLRRVGSRRDEKGNSCYCIRRGHDKEGEAGWRSSSGAFRR